MVPNCCCTLMTFFSTTELIMTLTTIFSSRILTLWRPGYCKNYLQLNAAKCKYMTISRKHSPPLNYQLSILNHRMEKVTEFKYLGLWLSDNMSWSTHIEKSSTRALKQVGLIYRKFYQYTSPECLQQLYLSFVRPHLEYTVPVWDPHCSSHVQTLERVQTFALKMCYKAWKDDYDSLLTRSGLQSLPK